MMTVEERKQISEQKKRAQAKHRGGLLDKEANPCLKEQELSMNCLNSSKKEDQDKKCQIYFENYQRCKDFWLKIQLNRRRKGIQPELPPFEEREKIKAEYLGRR